MMVLMKRISDRGPGGIRLLWWVLASNQFVYVGVAVALDVFVGMEPPLRGSNTVLFGRLGVVMAGAVAFALSLWAHARPLKCDSPSGLALSYRGRFFLGFGTSEVAALAGMVAFMLIGDLLTPVIGVGITLMSWRRFLPSEASLAQDQLVLSQAGCPHDLKTALASAWQSGEG